MTHIGFVAMVEHAPPVKEAYTLARNPLSMQYDLMQCLHGVLRERSYLSWS